MSLRIERHQLNILVEEVLIHTEAALMLYQQYNTLVTAPETRQFRFNWAILQGFLNAVAIVSKMLAPPRNASRARGEALQQALNTSKEDFPLMFDRQARNNMEHIDERLDLWLARTDLGLFEAVLESMGPIRLEDKVVRRLVILETMTFLSTNQDGELSSLSLQELAKELNIICERAHEWLNNDQSVFRIIPSLL